MAAGILKRMDMSGGNAAFATGNGYADSMQKERAKINNP